MLREAGVMPFVHSMGEPAFVKLMKGLASQDETERKLVDGGVYRPGDLVA